MLHRIENDVLGDERSKRIAHPFRREPPSGGHHRGQRRRREMPFLISPMDLAQISSTPRPGGTWAGRTRLGRIIVYGCCLAALAIGER